MNSRALATTHDSGQFYPPGAPGSAVFHLLPASGQKLARSLFYKHVEVKTNFTERNPYALRRAPAVGAKIYVPPEAADQPKND